ncbi:MAG: hypothetical protein K0U98_17385 [Deltaproteobacteria bacterium]|nr:hypothetical protein [Deltaproteobacteria bacterium]
MSTMRLQTVQALGSLLLSALFLLPTSVAQAGEHSLGLGVEYWKTVDGFPDSGTFDNLDEDGQSFLLSYQYKPAGLIRFELDLEYFDSGFAGSSDTAVAPQAFVLVGAGGLYGGIGIGVTISDGLSDDISDPFYMGRVGFQFSLLGTLKLDLHATYRFDAFSELEGISFSSDTYTLGAAARFRL